MAAGQCTHPAQWVKNGFDKRTSKPVLKCPLCRKQQIVGKTYTREAALVSRLKFVPIWLEGVGAREAAARLRVSYATVRFHYYALRDLYREHTGEVKRVDGRVKNTFTAEARAARLNPKSKAAAR